MTDHRFTEEDLETWRTDGVVLLPEFFTADEVAAVAADFETVFPDLQGADKSLNEKEEGEIGAFNQAQFKNIDNIPFDCSPALNLICVHPALIAMAKAALGTNDVQLYQSLAWAKYTGEADFDQPFHCDYGNHTLTVPSENEHLNAITFLVYFSDVTEAHGPTHYVTKPDSLVAVGSAASFYDDLDMQDKLKPYEKSAAGKAGSIFAYGIDVYHRGTNLTASGGYRYALTACFKKSGNDGIGHTAWQFLHKNPWHRIFDHATPDQLHCFGVPLPGDAFWTRQTIEHTQSRYPGWDAGEYQSALD